MLVGLCGRQKEGICTFSTLLTHSPLLPRLFPLPFLLVLSPPLVSYKLTYHLWHPNSSIYPLSPLTFFFHLCFLSWACYLPCSLNSAAEYNIGFYHCRREFIQWWRETNHVSKGECHLKNAGVAPCAVPLDLIPSGVACYVKEKTDTGPKKPYPSWSSRCCYAFYLFLEGSRVGSSPRTPGSLLVALHFIVSLSLPPQPLKLFSQWERWGKIRWKQSNPSQTHIA